MGHRRGISTIRHRAEESRRGRRVPECCTHARGNETGETTTQQVPEEVCRLGRRDGRAEDLPVIASDDGGHRGGISDERSVELEEERFAEGAEEEAGKGNSVESGDLPDVVRPEGP